MADILYKEESYAIIGACMEVYNEKGYGFVEPVFQECLEIEMRLRALPFQSQVIMGHEYKGVPLKTGFRCDLICYEKIVVELKAVSTILDEHRAQLFNYMRSGNFRLGLLINFGNSSELEFERIVL